jgi:hypothetical protein
LKKAQPELCDELGVVVLEQRAGRPRADSWRNMADRTDVDSVRNLVTMLIQSEQLGTSMARTLRIHADTLRTQRVQAVEEAAAKLTVKLLFPLVFFIFPVAVHRRSGSGGYLHHGDFQVNVDETIFEEGGIEMEWYPDCSDCAGILFVIVLVVLIQRRRTRVK